MAINGGSLELDVPEVTVPSISGTGGSVTASGHGTSTLGIDQSTESSFSGTIIDGTNTGGTTDKIALLKSGSGMLTLCGTNTFSGGTDVEGGTLRLGNPRAAARAA